MAIETPVFRRARTLLAITTVIAVGCENAPPTESAARSAGAPSFSTTTTETVYASGSVPVTAWDPTFPSAVDPNWPTTVCTATPGVGLNANWQNPHPATAFPLGTHPWEFLPPMDFDAQWINAWSDIGSRGAGGHSWTKYSTEVAGDGDFVVQFLADNCSWIYLDNTPIGVQNTAWQTSSGRYQLTLNGTHTLTFIIFDGGGAAGGKFRLETRQSFIDNGGDTDDLPPPSHATPPAIAAEVSGQLSFNGWYVSDVGVSWTVTDAESDVTSTTGCGPSTVTTDTPGASFTCSATSTGGSASQSVTVRRDVTAPVVQFAGNLGSYTVDQQVAITCSATDATSGVMLNTCANVSADAYTFGVGTHTLFASATDSAGIGGSGETQFTVQVTSGSLCAMVQRWVSQRGVANSLCQQIRNGALGAFRNHVSAQSGKFVSAAHAALLIAWSNEL